MIPFSPPQTPATRGTCTGLLLIPAAWHMPSSQEGASWLILGAPLGSPCPTPYPSLAFQ